MPELDDDPDADEADAWGEARLHEQERAFDEPPLPTREPEAPLGPKVVTDARRAARMNLAVLPVIALPIGDRDVVRAAFAWNLAVEVSRLGGRAVLLTPGREDPSPLWPEAGIGPMGAELVQSPVSDLGALYRVAIDTAVSRADGAVDGGLVLVRVPPRWLREPEDGAKLLRWTLLFATSETDHLRECYGMAKLVHQACPRAAMGVTIHGARKRQEAEEAFAKLARTTQRSLGRDLQSYGLLVDDLDVYRAIVAQRPIGLAHPQSPAARALRDVAQMLLDDARKRAVA
jgi:hypothetical protein